MNRNIIVAVAIAVAALLIFGVLAVQRGALTFSEGMPRFNGAIFMHPQPSIDREVTFPESFPENARPVYLSNLEKIKTLIKEDVNNYTAWNDLAIYYRMVEDHEGAGEVWRYLVAKYPNNGLLVHNLAEFEFHTTKNYAKAEELYAKAIALQPNMGLNYTDLHEMYRYAYKQDTPAAEEILKQGLQHVDVRLQVDFNTMLADYYIEKGRRDDAIAALTAARDIARALGNTALVTRLNNQIEAL